MKVITWNVNGVRAREAEVLELLTKHAPDVLCMQEIKATPEQLPPALGGLMGMPEYHSYWHGQGGYSGVSLHLRKARFEKVAFSHPAFDVECRVVEATAGDLSFLSMYLPNGGKDFEQKMDFLRELGAWAKKQSGRKVVLCGDMNVTRAEIDVHKTQRNKRVVGQRPDERELFEQLFATGLVDVGARSRPRTTRSLRGGRTGTTRASATSAGASTTWSRRPSSSRRCARAPSSASSERATTRRWSSTSTSEPRAPQARSAEMAFFSLSAVYSATRSLTTSATMISPISVCTDLKRPRACMRSHCFRLSSVGVT